MAPAITPLVLPDPHHLGAGALRRRPIKHDPAFVFRQYLRGCTAKEYLDADYRASRRRYGVWQVEGGITRP